MLHYIKELYKFYHKWIKNTLHSFSHGLINFRECPPRVLLAPRKYSQTHISFADELNVHIDLPKSDTSSSRFTRWNEQTTNKVFDYYYFDYFLFFYFLRQAHVTLTAGPLIRNVCLFMKHVLLRLLLHLLWICGEGISCLMCLASLGFSFKVWTHTKWFGYVIVCIRSNHVIYNIVLEQKSTFIYEACIRQWKEEHNHFRLILNWRGSV